ncbi:helix-turn-helix domain-containing protein [Actinosynnema sp. NPDC050436]|uniref:helix-turn-helix domain-containing protein n=1 Tax=Actinosynnema sp. NPDC050436 TaxID=3155659 RepID=UPI0033D1B0C6
MNQTESERGVLGRAFTLLDALVSHPDGVGLTWIAHFCGIPKATTHRLLRQLEALGVVERSSDLYRVGPQVFRLGQAWQPYPHLLAAARRPLQDLAAATRSGAVLTVRCRREDLVAATSPAGPEDVLLLRPGCPVPRDLDLVTTPVLTPTGRQVGAVGAVLPDQRRRSFVADAVRHAARAVNAALSRPRNPVG